MMNPNEPNYGQLPPQPQVSPQTVPAQPLVTPATPNAPGSPYEFILSPQQAPTKKMSLGGGNKALKLLSLIGGAAIVLILISVVLVSVLTKGESPQGLTGIVQQQQELVRIARLGEQQSTSETTKNLAYNIDLSVGTSQAQLLSYLAKHGTKLTEKELALAEDPKTDTLLTNAKATSTYDSAIQKVYASQLQAYISELERSFNGAKSSTLKQTLKANYTAGKTLLDQANSAMGQTDTTP